MIYVLKNPKYLYQDELLVSIEQIHVKLRVPILEFIVTTLVPDEDFWEIALIIHSYL